ncbi:MULTISPECIES: hypothetical protein [Streptomyces]|uniref:hypothetical protein n=1 Tax=Streptomyces TaxID=1883 RepID=UPI000A41309E|nr:MULTISPECIES: hypothetical protein [Streptomyces]
MRHLADTDCPGSFSVDSLPADRSSWLRGGMRPAVTGVVLGLGAGAVTLLIKP